MISLRYTGDPVTVRSNPSNCAVSRIVKQILGGCRLRVEVEVAVEHDAPDGGLLVGERAGERQANTALGVGRRLRYSVGSELHTGVVEDE